MPTVRLTLPPCISAPVPRDWATSSNEAAHHLVPVVEVELPEDAVLDDLKATIETSTGSPHGKQRLLCDGDPLESGSSLTKQLKKNSVITVARRRPRLQQAYPEQLREYAKRHMCCSPPSVAPSGPDPEFSITLALGQASGGGQEEDEGSGNRAPRRHHVRVRREDTVGQVLDRANLSRTSSRIECDGEVLATDATLAASGIEADAVCQVSPRRRRYVPTDTSTVQAWASSSPRPRRRERLGDPGGEGGGRGCAEGAGGGDGGACETAAAAGAGALLLLREEAACAQELLGELEANPHSWRAVPVTPVSHRLSVEVLLLMLERLGLLEGGHGLASSSHAGISRAAATEFLLSLADHYAFNPYHNFSHALDVTAGIYIYLLQMGAAERLRPHLQLALLLAAVGHDVGHPGTTNAHEAQVRSELHARYPTSTLERYHSSLMLQLLARHELLAPMPEQQREEARRLIEFSILGTDIALSGSIVAEFLQQLKGAEEEETPRAGGGDEEAPQVVAAEGRQGQRELQLARMLLKGADLGCCTRSFPIGLFWAEELVREYVESFVRVH
jgi:hypothetical protein